MNKKQKIVIIILIIIWLALMINQIFCKEYESIIKEVCIFIGSFLLTSIIIKLGER